MQTFSHSRHRSNRIPFVAGALLTLAMGVSVQAASAPTVSAPAQPQQQPQVEKPQPRQAKVKPAHRWFQLGRASWYGRRFQGKATANGEAFDMNQFTCAHRDLPLGSWLKVTNLRNRKSIIVRVNDRGPMEPNRIVDLSYAAAHRLDITGLGRVRLELLPKEGPALEAAVANMQDLTPAPILPR